MIYKIKRNISSNELYHAKEGEERKDHKYIARVLLKRATVSGKQRNIYRYFYDKKSYQAYMKSKQKLIKRTVDKFKNITNKSIKIPETIKLSTGEEVKFDSKDEYKAYKERLEYQKNEPEFMKEIKNIPDNHIFKASEDMGKINEKLDPYSDEYSLNCSNCSAAYELRRRGYDVEAKAYNYREYNGSTTRVYDYFKNAEKIAVYGNGDTKILNEDSLRKIYLGDSRFIDTDSYNLDESTKFLNSEQLYETKSVEKAIKKHSPPGSRGMIDVKWKQGGCHSLIYEVDMSGKIIIRDSQLNTEYELDNLVSYSNNIDFTRTDNLELKEDILNAVKMNEENIRRYHADKDFNIYHY